MKVNFKKFKKDSYFLDKEELIKVYLWLHSDSEEVRQLNKSQNIKMRHIVKQVLTDKYDVTLGSVFDSRNELH